MDITNTEKEFLNIYSDEKYKKPSVTVDAVIFRIVDKQSSNYRKLPEKKLQVFLLKRNNPPFKNAYALPGTFIDLENELIDTVKSCVKNKVGLNDYYIEQLYTFGDINRDPRTRILSVSYMLLTHDNNKLGNGSWYDIELSSKTVKKTEKKFGYIVKKDILLTLKKDLSEQPNIKSNSETNSDNCDNILKSKINVNIEKINLEEIKKVNIINSDIAFDHSKIIFYAIERLKNKLEYTDIIFNLLPKKFTLTELKQAYEIILNEKLLDANFRRKTAKMVIGTKDYATGKGFRSSQLFEHNPLWTITDID